MAVAVDRSADMTFGPPHQLFRAPIAGDPASGRDFYAVDADGARFLIDTAGNGNEGESITIMVNWAAGTAGQQQVAARIAPHEP